MQHATRRLGGGLRRCMDQERTHGDDAACRCRALDRLNARGEALNLDVRKNPERVRSRKDAQRSVVGTRIIEMKPQRDDARQCICRRMRVMNPALHRPRSPALDIATRSQRKRTILMPGHKPIRAWRFVEERCLERYRFRRQKAPRDRQERGMLSGLANGRMPHEMPRTAAAALNRNASKRRAEGGDLRLAQHARNDFKSSSAAQSR